MRTRAQMVDALTKLIAVASEARSLLVEKSGDDGFAEAFGVLGTHPWDVDRMMSDEAGELHERQEEKNRREGLYVAHYTFQGRRHYVPAQPSDPALPENVRIPAPRKGRRIFTSEQRESFGWEGTPEGARHHNFTRVGRVLA